MLYGERINCSDADYPEHWFSWTIDIRKKIEGKNFTLFHWNTLFFYDFYIYMKYLYVNLYEYFYIYIMIVFLLLYLVYVFEHVKILHG